MSGWPGTAPVLVLAVAAALAACTSVTGPRPADATKSTAACHHDAPACAPAPVAYAAVAPIVERRCFGCHAGNGMAAGEYDFSDETTVTNHRKLVASAVQSCAMPPPPAPPLGDEETKALLMWAACPSR